MVDLGYERLSAQDSSFLVFETPTTHMHVGGVAILDAGPVTRPQGGIDVERIRSYIDSRLEWIPRYRQRLAYTPIERHPIWIDDDHFNIHYHVRHASLPRPGDERQLKELAGRIMSQQLDRGKPLWEAWIVEGLEGNRFAFISKSHHCMVDGIASVDLLSALMSATPQSTFEPAAPWIPRPAPGWLDLLRNEAARRTRIPFDLLSTVRNAIDDPEGVGAQLRDRLNAAAQVVAAGLRPPADTPLNRPIGPHRRFDWLALDLAQVKQVKNHFGGTVNDVVLATTAGAVRRFMQRHRVDVDDIDYRVVLPVNTRPPEEHGKTGNRVSAWITSLPIHERSPQRRLARVREETAHLKESKQALGAEALTQVGEFAGSGVLTLGVRLAVRLHPYNLIITNVPGPQTPLYMLDSQMLDGYPQVPLFENQGIGVALLSYSGNLYWGVNADWELVPDLPHFIQDIGTSFRELHRAAERHVRDLHADETPESIPKRKPAARASRRPTTRKRSSNG